MMVSDSENKPRDLFHRRVLKSYHKRQQMQRMRSLNNSFKGDDNQLIIDSSSSSSSCATFVPKKRFRVKEVPLSKVKPTDNSCSNTTSTESTESSSKSSSEVPSSENHDEYLNIEGGEKEILNTKLKYGFISMIGRRRVMEDAVTVDLPVANEFAFFAAYDGHGGSSVSHACRDRLHRLLDEELLEVKKEANHGNSNKDRSTIDWEEVMMTCFSKMDDEVMRGGSSNGVEGIDEGYDNEAERTVGSTAVVVMVGKEEIVVANCGDCRAVICSRGVAIPLSNDHKPDRPDEKKRVEAAGGKILNWNGSRVQGVLATSRSIGDHYLKPFVIPEPEVMVYKRHEWDEFLVIATDGLWDVVSNEVACEVVRKCLDGQLRRRFPERDGMAEAAALLTKLAIDKGSKDNISVIVVELDKSSYAW